MFSLWRDIKAKVCKIPRRNKKSVDVNENYEKVPSPRQNRCYGQCKPISFGRHLYGSIIKRTRMFISCFGWTEASMTVEASLVLPLFLVFLVSLGSAIEMIRLHANIELALYDVGRRMSVYGYALADGNEVDQESDKFAGEIMGMLGEVALTNFYVEKQVIQYLGEEYLDASPIIGGSRGLNFSESELLDEEGCMEIVVTYRVSLAVGVAALGDFRMMNRYYGHIWSGYKLPDDEVRGVIYITENGTVYHENKNCTHLSLSMQKIAMEKVASSRNNAGNRYQACDRCISEGMVDGRELVYITGEGDRFHKIRECPGLKRTVYTVPEVRKEEFRPCSRCACGE